MIQYSSAKTMTKKPSLIVAIPAYNEEANITRLLEDLIVQNQENYVLREIRIYTDASTDNTPKLIKAFRSKHKIVKLIEGKERKGKYFRYNQALSTCTT